MPWQEYSIMSQRLDFVRLAQQKGTNFRELCRRFNISPTTGYKWCSRMSDLDPSSLSDRSRRPRTSPSRTPEAMENVIIELRDQQYDWGGRKLRNLLIKQGHTDVPSASTITEILRRHGLLDEQEAVKHAPFVRFEHSSPNDLWQMDFKGHFPILNGRCHPLTILDDHSRYSILVKACSNEQSQTVQEALIDRFRLYGLPHRMLMDNGSPWSGQGQGITALEAWLMRLNIKVTHGRPHHPQTQGKDERFHRTLKSAVISRYVLNNIEHCQQAFDDFRQTYNHVRPHEALDMNPPASRYRASQRNYPETMPSIEYDTSDHVRKVDISADIRYKGRKIKVGRGLAGQYVALRPTLNDGVYDLVYCNCKIKTVDFRENTNP